LVFFSHAFLDFLVLLLQAKRKTMDKKPEKHVGKPDGKTWKTPRFVGTFDSRFFGERLLASDYVSSFF